ncbi:putative cytochrome P450 [Cercophora scortea]|uniref:Cytochrome P450 n=1 Tax=Cercophora scortea TaxID=314031 RepID=A0AAE0I7P4_9PEZI|nr:putative cytochrome P450 [Cercophora scortea]
MSSMASDPTVLIIIATGVATLGFLAARNMFGGHDPREPPLAPQSIPIIGHLVGLSRSSFEYYVDLSHQTSSPIFTISLPGQKMYVITKPEFVQTVQKHHKILAFPPIEAKFASKICGASLAAQAILDKNLNGDEGDHGLSMETYAGMREALKPGEELDDMNRSMISEVAKAIDLLAPADGESQRFGMYTWLRDAITTATTRSVYGPMNPYDDKAIADAFWEFESGLMTILVGILPSITARKPIAARTKVADALEAYYKAGGVQKASFLARKRYEVQVNNGVPLADIARYEVGGSIAVLVNTAPSAFWLLLFLHSHPNLLEQIRAEIDACTVTTTENNTTVKTLDITTLKENSPLLLSAYQETLRHRSMGTSVREVMQDTYLDQFLLKKGAMLQMPSRVIHQDTSLWGADAAEFNPRRFLAEEKANRPRDVCFRAFGGGKTLCPGRHFATNEILATVALFVARLDMWPVSGSGEATGWKIPTSANTNVAAVVMEPDEDIEVEVRMRKGFEGVKWRVGLKRSDKVFAMVTEDTSSGEVGE